MDPEPDEEAPVLTVPLAPAPHNHRVLETLRLSEVLRLPGAAAHRLSLRYEGADRRIAARPVRRSPRQSDVPLQAMDRRRLRTLARALAQCNLEVVTTGGPDPAERTYLDALWNGAAVKRLDGRLDWPQITKPMGDAAVSGIDAFNRRSRRRRRLSDSCDPGPVDPRLMGPWPVGGLAEPWAAAGRVQRRGNVWVVQNPLPSLPCERLGCDGHLNSRSQCLDELSVQQVLGAVDEALQSGSWRT